MGTVSWTQRERSEEEMSGPDTKAEENDEDDAALTWPNHRGVNAICITTSLPSKQQSA